MSPRAFELPARTLQYLRRSRVHLALSRAAATAPARALDPTNPDTWEFSAFSTAGEDGIIDYLTRRMRDPEYVFLDIGAGDGVVGNTAWLGIARKWPGLMVEADAGSAQRARSALQWFNPLVEVLELLVSEANAPTVLASMATRRPDVFSLDIDSIDYHVAQALFERGLRPRLCVVEYNSTFGPERSCTVNPALLRGTGARFYYGVSIAAWRGFFERHDYHFVGVERTGVNAFFAHRETFDSDFLDAIRGREFAENLSQRRGPEDGWKDQLRTLDGLDLVEVP